jgi:hypothetical protein
MPSSVDRGMREELEGSVSGHVSQIQTYMGSSLRFSLAGWVARFQTVGLRRVSWLWGYKGTVLIKCSAQGMALENDVNMRSYKRTKVQTQIRTLRRRVQSRMGVRATPMWDLGTPVPYRVPLPPPHSLAQVLGERPHSYSLPPKSLFWLHWGLNSGPHIC